MNLNRKLWWAQHKNDVYKYSTFILLFLIVTISIIYFTYSKFSSSNEMTMYEITEVIEYYYKERVRDFDEDEYDKDGFDLSRHKLD